MSSVIPKVTKLSPRIIRILGCNPGPMTLQGTNTYIIGTGKRRLLLDTGEWKNSEYIESLSTVLKDLNVSLDYIILTHWHHDHVGGVSDILETIGKPTIFKYPRLGIKEELLEPAKDLLLPLEDKQEILVDDSTLRIHHTPGHTTDHVVVHLEEENAVFSGDCILGEGTAVFEDLFDYMKSLKIILDLAPSIVYPGHGPVISTPKEKITYYIEHRNQREQQIIAALKEVPGSSITAAEIVKRVYTDTPAILLLAAECNVRHHLEKLKKEGLIDSSSNSDGDVLWTYLDVVGNKL